MSLHVTELAKSQVNVVSQVQREREEPILISWEDGDPDHPHNWSRARRWYITILASILVFNATFASAAPSGVIVPLMNEFNMSHEVSILTISLFVAGYCVGPLIWAPLSEQYGRKPVFVLSFLLYTVFQIAGAVANNTVSILLFRLFGGIFAAGPLANSGAIISDVWDADTQGKALALFTASFNPLPSFKCSLTLKPQLAPFAGPALGPTVSGYLTVARVSWRWLFWLLAIFAAICLLLIVFTLPETYSPVLLVRKAKRMREETNDPRFLAPSELVRIPFKNKLQIILLRPFRILFDEPMLMAITAYMSFIYGNVYLLFQAYPIVFSRGHNFNPGLSGLMLLNIPVGGATGVLIYLVWYNPRHRRTIQEHAPHPVAPEMHLDMALAGAPLLVVSFFVFSWTSYPSLSFVLPLLGGVLMGTATLLVFLSLTKYIVYAYLPVAASALAASVVCRSLAGAVFPLFANQMYDALNPRWAGTLLGFVAVLMMPIPFALIKYGPRLRNNSKYSPSKSDPPHRKERLHSADLKTPSTSSIISTDALEKSIPSVRAPEAAKLSPV